MTSPSRIIHFGLKILANPPVKLVAKAVTPRGSLAINEMGYKKAAIAHTYERLQRLQSSERSFATSS